MSNFHYARVFSLSLQWFLGLFSVHYLELFHFSHLNGEKIHLKTLIEFLSFLISTQQHVGEGKDNLV